MSEAHDDLGSEYDRYIRTKALRALQLRDDELVHSEEFLFHATHQAIEIELRVAVHLLSQAARAITLGAPDAAVVLIGRAAEIISVVADLTEPLRHITPVDFAVIRTVFGTASGAQSPGWREVRRSAREVEHAFHDDLDERAVTLGDVYVTVELAALRRVAEALIEFDDRVRSWYGRHYVLATRMLGETGVGTGGMPITELHARTQRTLFPRLWDARLSLAPAD